MKFSSLPLATLLLAQGLSAQFIQEAAEPNDSAATATVLPIGRQAFGWIDATQTDHDFYRITLPERCDLKAWGGPGRDYWTQVSITTIRLLASDGVTVLQENMGAGLATGRYGTMLVSNLAAGTYYVDVQTGAANRGGDYSLDVVTAPLGTLALIPEVQAGLEPDDPRQFGLATPTTWNSINYGYCHAGGFGDRNPFAFGVDYDLFAIPVTGPCHLDLSLLQTNDPNAAGHPVMFFTDPGFSPVGFSQPVGNGGIIEQMGVDLTFAGTYYVAVHGLDGWDVGTYKLLIQGIVREKAEPNDPRLPGGAATPMTLGTICTGYSSVGGDYTASTFSNADYDWYQFDLQAPCWVEFSALRAGMSPNYTVPLLHMFDSNFNLIEEGIQMHSGEMAERLSADVTQSGRYYVAISGWGDPHVGNYTMRARALPPRATTDYVLGNCAGSNGVPDLRSTPSYTNPWAYPERPVLGSTFTLTGTSLPAGAPLFRMTSLLLRPTPLDLTVYGGTGCLIYVDPAATDLAFADANGFDHWALALPMQLSLVGLPLAQQLLVYDPPANSLGLTASGYATSVCGLAH